MKRKSRIKQKKHFYFIRFNLNSIIAIMTNKIKNYIENAEKEWEQEILNKIIPPTADVLVPDMDSRGMRERAKSFITSKLLGLLEVIKDELPAQVIFSEYYKYNKEEFISDVHRALEDIKLCNGENIPDILEDYYDKSKEVQKLLEEAVKQ